MSDSERIELIKKYTGLSTNYLAKEIGLKTPQTLYDILKGKHGISRQVADAISAKYLKINRTWLLTGEGEMLKRKTTDHTENNHHTSTDLITNPIIDYEMSAFIQSLLDALERRDTLVLEQQKEISKQGDRVDRLIDILEKNLHVSAIDQPSVKKRTVG